NLLTGVVYWCETSEAMHGLAPGTFGRNFGAFLACIHPEDCTHVHEVIDRATREHQNAEIDYRTVWPDGTERHISSTCRFFYDDTRRTDMDEISKAARRAAGLTHQLLAFSRKQILAPRVLHMGDVVTGVAPMLRRLIGETIDLRTTVADRRYVKADAGQIEQVL